MKIALFLITTFIIDEDSLLFKKKYLTNNEKRIKHYIDGINSINFFKHDVILLDNSSPLDKLPHRLQKTINSNPNIQYINNTKNVLGKLNKTAGVLDVYRNNIDLLKKYDMIIHFEPRQKIVENTFFFLPGNNFFVDKTNKQFHTGLFSIDSNNFIKFINEYNPDDIVKNNLQLESILFQFIDNNKIKFNRVEKLGLIWYDSYKNDRETLI